MKAIILVPSSKIIELSALFKKPICETVTENTLFLVSNSNTLMKSKYITTQLQKNNDFIIKANLTKYICENPDYKNLIVILMYLLILIAVYELAFSFMKQSNKSLLWFIR